jgi:uncharacterized protein HemY
MKKLLLIVVLLNIVLLASACPACEKQQPKILQGITHGGGPQSNWDYIIIAAAALIVLVTLFFSVKWLVRPGEKSGSHIKYFILNNE